MSREEITTRLDEAVDDFVKRTRIFNEDITLGRARMFVLQHRQNTRYRNSVLKLRVATNCPVWDIKLGILEACSEEIIADHEFGDGRPHWKIVEDLVGPVRDFFTAHIRLQRVSPFLRTPRGAST